MTDRGRETLAAVDVVAAEDTRRTGRLLARLGIKARQVSLHAGNERARTGRVLALLRRGLDVAVVSDAGMPAVSDPGFLLVRACAEEGIDVRVVPGPSAALAALVVSGLPTDRFAFEGFLPRRAWDRRARLAAMARDPRTMILFESPRRTRATLRQLGEALGDRRVALVRELTKMHEQVVRGRISDVLTEFEGRELRGEVALVVEGAPEESSGDARSAARDAAGLMAAGLKPRAAAAEAARLHGVPPNQVYRALVDRA
jgi:16S rRNA (cytidine1402-2'-O)-methyltransferase